MPLPLIIPIGAAIITAIYGTKKGVDAKRDFDKAEEDNEQASGIYDRANRKLNKARKRTQARLEALGKRKKAIYEDGLIPFVEAFDRIKNVELDRGEEQAVGLPDITEDMLELRRITAEMAELVGGSAGALGAGALAGLAAYGSVGLVASASTGTAIGTLTGAAATNATLAWLGGGTLAAGGLGITGGLAVLGGIVAAPVLLVGGMLLASKAEQAKENAKSNRRKAEAAAEAMKTARVAARAIMRAADEVNHVLKKLYERLFVDDLVALQQLVSNNDDYRTYNRGEKDLVARAVTVAVTLKNVMQAPLLEDDGSIAPKIKKTLQDAAAVLRELEAV